MGGLSNEVKKRDGTERAPREKWKEQREGKRGKTKKDGTEGG
jgi:hypothetical protein